MNLDFKATPKTVSVKHIVFDYNDELGFFSPKNSWLAFLLDLIMLM